MRENTWRICQELRYFSSTTNCFWLALPTVDRLDEVDSVSVYTFVSPRLAFNSEICHSKLLMIYSLLQLQLHRLKFYIIQLNFVFVCLPSRLYLTYSIYFHFVCRIVYSGSRFEKTKTTKYFLHSFYRIFIHERALDEFNLIFLVDWKLTDEAFMYENNVMLRGQITMEHNFSLKMAHCEWKGRNFE